MGSGEEELMQKVEKALNQLTEEDRKVLIYDADFNVAERDAILIKMGFDNQPKRWRYVQKLRKRVKEIVESYD